jgi:putative two-component system response regulator
MLPNDYELTLELAESFLARRDYAAAGNYYALAEKIKPDLILLDVEMPECDGFTALERMKMHNVLADVPVIFLTAVQNTASEIKGFELGAVDFINKPFSAPILLKRIELHIETDKVIKKSQSSLRKMQNAMISVISELVEDRDKITGGHIERTQAYIEILIDELMDMDLYISETSAWDLTLLVPSAQLHDVGKITISDIILNKPGKLTAEEFEIIKSHVSEGERIIEEIMKKTHDDGFLHYAKLFAGYHHEKWNGTGYPRGLSGTNIPLEGRVMAIADVYDALSTKRPYKEALPHEKVIEIMVKDTGTHFDPDLIEVFKNVSDKFYETSIEIRN